MNPKASEVVPETPELAVTPIEQISVPPPKRPASAQQLPPKSASQQLVSRTVAAHFSGPMPPPDLLGRYEEICPGSADRMLRMAEDEAGHRRKIENAIVDAQIQNNRHQFSESRRGQLCALTITIAAIVAGVYTANQGHEIAGSIIGVGGIGGIVTSFILGRHKPKVPETPPKEPDKSESKQKQKRKR